MSSAVFTGRRGFLKGSVLAGAAATLAPPAQAAQQGEGQAAPAAPIPSEQKARAETGPIGHASAHAPILDPGSDYMVQLLRQANVSYVAAMPGSTFRGLHESIVNFGGNTQPELITCVHEEVSAAMAHGYAKVALRPMACLVHGNVGLQHASMAIYNAWCDRAPILVLAGNGLDAAKRRPGVEWLHTTQDLAAMVRDFVKFDDAPVSLEAFGDSFMRAYEVSMTPPYEPVMLVVDSELQEEPANRGKLGPARLAAISPPAGDPAAIERAAALLVDAEAPVIVADRLARTPQGVSLLATLAELLNAPVIDRGGRLNLPTNHYLNHTMRQARLIPAADVILGLELTDIWGLINDIPDVPDREPVRLARADAKVIGISANYIYLKSNQQDLQRHFAADITIAADGEASLPALIAAVRRRLSAGRRKVIAARAPALKSAFDESRSASAASAAKGWDASPISTARMCMELWDKIKGSNWGLVSSTAFCSFWPQRLWDITEHHQFIGAEGGYGVGYGLPAAAGAALAHRDAGRFAVAIQADGDLMVLPGTLWTLAHHSIPLLMVMHNNRAWHQETMHLQRMANRRNRAADTWSVGTVLQKPDIDYAQMAKSMGVWAEGPISDPEAVGPALARALAVVRSGKPALVDVLTQAR